MQRRRFYAAPETITDSVITLSPDESHHLTRVLRLRAGDDAFTFDGIGHEYRCRVTLVDRRGAQLEIVEAMTDEVESPIAVTLAQSLAKGEKFDFIVQKATELGVRRIVPLITENADVKLNDERAEKRMERWRRIALEALKQSGGRRLVDIAHPATITDFFNSTTAPDAVDSSAAPGPLPLVFSEHGGVPIATAILRINPTLPVAAFVGPEGGWSNDELDLLKSRGAVFVTLGPRILRTETAALVAVTLLQHQLGNLS
jgi:16S rRNA (uracil1498-N3)-methyltransferase